MAAYLLTWNPAKQFEWSGLPETADRVRAGDEQDDQWSCWSKAVRPGDTLFLLKQGKEPRGIVGIGVATGAPSMRWHWRDGRKKQRYVPLRWRSLLDPGVDAVLEVHHLPQGLRRRDEWRTRISGIVLPDAAARELLQIWTRHCSQQIDLRLADEEEISGLEGPLVRRYVLHRKRESWLRQEKIESILRTTGALRCEVPRCNFDFRARYGELGKAYAQVHHLKPLSARDGVRETKLSDLAVVCANCHVMIHLCGKCRDMARLIPRRGYGGRGEHWG